MEVVSKLDITKIINNMPISILIDFLNLTAFEKLLSDISLEIKCLIFDVA